MRRRTTYAVLCTVAAVLAVLAGIAGSVLATTFGPDDAIVSAPTAVDADGAAVLAEQLRVDAGNLPVPTTVGTLTIDVDPVGPRALFVGQASASDLNAYFRGVPYDVVVSLDPGGSATLRRVPGSVLPVAPGEESFWSSAATGTPGQTVSFDTTVGDRTSLVIMNAEPSNGVQVDLRVTYTLPGVWRAALILLGAALVLGLLAVLACWRSRAAGKRARAAALALRTPVSAPAASSAADVLPSTPSPPSPAGTDSPPTAPLPTVRPLPPPASPTPPAGGGSPDPGP